MYSRYPFFENEETAPRGGMPPRAHVSREPAEESPPKTKAPRGGLLEGFLGARPGQGLGGALSGVTNGIGGLLRNLKLDWDSGDILLILIILFLSTESDDTEIIIMLALILFMGLGDS